MHIMGRLGQAPLRAVLGAECGGVCAVVLPEQLGKIIVPCGTTTIIADPHEIANVCGLEGMNYMFAAAKKTKLQIIYSVPSCVPATNFEDSGAILEADDIISELSREISRYIDLYDK